MLRGFLRSFSSKLGTGNARSSWVATLTFVVAVLLAFPLSAGAATPPAAHYSGYQTTLGSGFSSPTHLAVDASGDIFVGTAGTYAGDGVIYEIVAVNGVASASSQIKTLFSGLDHPNGLAVDSSGNVYIADGGQGAGYNGSLFEIVAPNSGTPNVITLSNAYINPNGITVDKNGDVFFVDNTGGVEALYEMVASGGTVSPSSAINQVANGFNDPAAVVVDVNGNIFVADYYNRAVEEITPAEIAGGTPVGSSTWTSIPAPNGGYPDPTGLGVDSNGNVFVACDDGTVYKVAAVSGAVSSSSAVATVDSNLGGILGMALDSSDDIFLTIPANTNITEYSTQPVNMGSLNWAAPARRLCCFSPLTAEESPARRPF